MLYLSVKNRLATSEQPILIDFTNEKPTTSGWVQTQITRFYLILPQFSFFYDFCAKKVKRTYFHQPLECTIPKHRFKYTTCEDTFKNY